MANIIIFGGSNVYGVWDTEGGWVGRLRTYFEKDLSERSTIGKHYIGRLIYNLGVPANGSRELLERAQFEIRQRSGSGGDDVIIFDIGKNDSALTASTNQFIEKPSVFARNIIEIIEATKVFSKNIVFLALLPVDESRTSPVYWNNDLVYKNEYAEKYNHLLKDACDLQGVNFLDVYLAIIDKPNWQNLFEDGLHLNSKGYRFVFELVKDYLEKNKFIK